jgi:hypothetical protein
MGTQLPQSNNTNAWLTSRVTRITCSSVIYLRLVFRSCAGLGSEFWVIFDGQPRRPDPHGAARKGCASLRRTRADRNASR